MNGNSLKLQIASMRQSLFDEGYLDEQFIELENLQDEETPSFVEEVVNLFFTDSVRYIDNIEEALESRPIDFGRLDEWILRFKGSSSSIGAKKVTSKCMQLLAYSDTRDVEGCIRTFQNATQEHAILREKLESYFELVRQGGADA